jgi:RNA polymerase sigma factor (sigma-70 family)
VARRHGVTGASVEDVVQDGLMGFIQSFRGDVEDELGAWRYLCRAVQTRAWRHHRTARRRPVHRSLNEDGEYGRAPSLAEQLADVESPDPLERTISDAGVVERRQLFAELPADWRAVLALGALGYGSREIGRLLGMSERQVRKRVEKGHARLAALLDEREAEE